MGRNLPTKLTAGKLPPELLKDLLFKYTNAQNDPRVRTTPAQGDDAAVIDMGQFCMVSKTDPITLGAHHVDDLGYYVVNINANDVITKGAVPRWFQSTLLFPVGTTKQDIEKVFFDIKKSCDELGIFIIGGHTEITPAVTHPVAVGNMMGEVLKESLETRQGEAEKEHLINPQSIEVGDDVIVIKGIAIEGTALIANEKPDLLKSKGLDDAFIAKCKKFLRAPGINASVPAAAAFKAGIIHAMHDPTEGGLGNALQEIAEYAGVGMKIYPDRVKIYDETKQLCAKLGLDPMFLLASGAMIVIAPSDETVKIVKAIRNLKLDASVIGSTVDQGEGVYFIQSGQKVQMKGFQPDEILKVL
jgi:hydrogenase maturation factor